MNTEPRTVTVDRSLIEAAINAAAALQAAAKIVRANGKPKVADVIAAKGEALVIELQRAAGEIE